MRNKAMDFVIIFLYSQKGFGGKQRAALHEALVSLKPDYLEFAGETSVRIAFRTRGHTAGRLDPFIRRLEAALVEAPVMGDVRIGGGEGLCACRTDAWGRVRDVGLGGVTYQAMRAAVG